MLTPYSILKSRFPRSVQILLGGLSLSFYFSALAETFLGTSSATNKLEIAEGEIIILRTWQVASSGPTNYWRTREREFELARSTETAERPVTDPVIIAGPGELVRNQPTLATYDRFKATNAWSFHTSETNRVFQVPKNGRLVISAPLPNPSGGPVTRYTFSNDSGDHFQGFIWGLSRSEVVLDGPGVLEIPQNPSSERFGLLLTVYIISNEVILTNGAVSQEGSGLLLMESRDLKQWKPAGLISPGPDPQKYYRIVGGK